MAALAYPEQYEDLTTSISENVLPSTKSQAYAAIFESAIDQLSVLSQITPEALKTDNKEVQKH